MPTSPPDAAARRRGRPVVLARRRAGRMLLAAACVTVGGLAVSPPPAATATTEDAPRTARLVVNGLQAVVGPPTQAEVPDGEEASGLPSRLTARVLVQNLDDEPLDGLRLVVAVHERVTTRSGLRAALRPGSPAIGQVELLAVDQPIDPVPPGGVAQLDVAVDAAEAGLVTDEDVTIHPIAVSVAQGVNVLDQVRTAAVGVARPIARPIASVAVVPLDGPVADDATQAPLLPGGRLDRLLRALEAAPVGTVTIAPAPHTLEDLQDLVAAAVPGATDIDARLRAVATDRALDIVSAPYAYADVPALAATTSTADLAAAAVVAGRQRIASGLGVTPGGAHLVVAKQSDAALELVPTDVVLTGWSDAAGPDLDDNPSADIPPARRTHRTAAGRTLTVLVADPWITQALSEADGRHGWEVDAHRAVAETAMLFAAAPGREGRVVVTLPPLGWEAPGLLADEVLQRLGTAPWLDPSGPVTAASGALAVAPWDPESIVAPERSALLGRVAQLEDRLAGLAASVADMEEPPPVVNRTDDLLRVTSTWPTEAPLERGQRVIEDLAAAVDEAIGEVVIPRDSVITLASERGVLPVTVQHPEGVPLDVLVEVEAQGRLSFPDGTSRAVRLEEGGATTVSFPTTALGRGTFPMTVTVSTLTGDVVLARTLVPVRASAVSRPALVAVGVIVLLLLLVGRLRRPRRARRERHLEVVR